MVDLAMPTQPPAREGEESERNPYALRTFAAFLVAIEEGRLAADLDQHLEAIGRTLEARVNAMGTKQKAVLKLSIEISLDDSGVFEIRAKDDLKLPEDPRRRSMLYLSPTGAPFSNASLRQLDMFSGQRPLRTL